MRIAAFPYILLATSINLTDLKSSLSFPQSNEQLQFSTLFQSSIYITVEWIRCLEVAEKMASGSGQILTNKFCIFPGRLMHKPTAFSSPKMAKVSFPDGPTAALEVTRPSLEN